MRDIKVVIYKNEYRVRVDGQMMKVRVSRDEVDFDNIEELAVAYIADVDCELKYYKNAEGLTRKEAALLCAELATMITHQKFSYIWLMSKENIIEFDAIEEQHRLRMTETDNISYGV